MQNKEKEKSGGRWRHGESPEGNEEEDRGGRAGQDTDKPGTTDGS